MCIRDRYDIADKTIVVKERTELNNIVAELPPPPPLKITGCLLYTSDAADERSSVDLGGRRIIKKNNKTKYIAHRHYHKTH